jgi:hypothetical protein
VDYGDNLQQPTDLAPASPNMARARDSWASGADIVKWLGLFGRVSRFYKWMTAGFTPQPGIGNVRLHKYFYK